MAKVLLTGNENSSLCSAVDDIGGAKIIEKAAVALSHLIYWIYYVIMSTVKAIFKQITYLTSI
jgi:hypothetical protein